MKIYVLRHGETSWNRQRLLQGRSDVELNENGRKLAKETAEGMADIPFDLVFTSPLKRAKETAEIVLNGRDIPIVATQGARYTVPKTMNPERMEDAHTVRFRVGDVYQNCYVSVYFDEERVLHRKRPVVAPGEMEQVVLKKEQLQAYPDLKQITIKIEEA